MGGEDVGLAHQFLGLVERHAGGHQFADAFQGQESRVPFVHVPDGRIEAQLAQGTHPTDAQQHFLRNAYFRVIGVQAGRQIAVGGGIFFDVAAHQIERDPPHLDQPQACQNIAPRQLDGDGQGIALVIFERQDGHFVEIESLVADLLPAVLGDVLNEVTLVVNEADGHQRQAQVTGFFQMVTGKDAQPAGIDR